MLKVSEILNSIKLKSISFFKIIILLVLSLYFDNCYILVLICIFLLLSNRKELIYFIFFYGILYLLKSYSIDFIPIGIIDGKENSYFIVNKILYRCKTYENVNVGDVILTTNPINLTKISELKHNYLFECCVQKALFNIPFKQFLFSYIESMDSSLRNVYLKYLYNINIYDDSIYNIGYGIVSYYIIKFFIKKNKILGILFLILYSLLFSFDCKFILFILDLLFSKQDQYYKFSFKLLIILLLNRYLFNNYSFLIPILISLYSIVKITNFRTFISLIDVLLFHELDILRLLLFKGYIGLQSIIFIILLLSLVIHPFENLLVFLLNIMTFINNIDLSLRGTIHPLLLIFIYTICKHYSFHFNLITLVILLLLPLNNLYDKISFINVGQGDSMLFRNRLYGETVLLDTGSPYYYSKLKSYLYSQGIYQIDYLIITHNDSDHNGNIENLENDFKINEIIETGKDFTAGDFNFIYHDIGSFDNDNDNSLIYSLNINNLNYLFTGDMSKNVEKILLLKYPDLKCDVLKVSHHGSDTATSDYFISQLLPKIGVISTNGNYGHPAQETLDTLDNYLVDYYITKNDGTIEFTMTHFFNLLSYHNHLVFLMN